MSTSPSVTSRPARPGTPGSLASSGSSLRHTPPAPQIAMSIPTTPALAGFHHVDLTVSDVEASETWYARVLGFQRIFLEKHATSSADRDEHPNDSRPCRLPSCRPHRQ